MSKTDTRGFTLLELLIALAVSAILMTSALPSLSGLIQRNRLETARHAFITALAFAKTEAIKRNTDVSLCPSRDGAHCLPTGDWQYGWIAFEDRDENREPESGEPILRRHGPLTSGITLISSNSRRVITFQPLGTAGGSNATFIFCDQHADITPLKAVLSIAGRVRWQAASDCDL